MSKFLTYIIEKDLPFFQISHNNIKGMIRSISWNLNCNPGNDNGGTNRSIKRKAKKKILRNQISLGTESVFSIYSKKKHLHQDDMKMQR